MEPIINTHLLLIGTRVALHMTSRSNNSILGTKDDEPITISKIKEDGSVYLKGTQAPTSVAFKLNSHGVHTYTRSETYGSTDYKIITVESAIDQVNVRAGIRKVHREFDELMNEPMTFSRKQAIVNFIKQLKNTGE